MSKAFLRSAILLLMAIFAFCLGSFASYAIRCDDYTHINFIPCTVITPEISCGSYTFNMTNLTNKLQIVTDGDLNAVGDGTYSFNFNFTSGRYGFRLCDGDYAELTVRSSDMMIEPSGVCDLSGMRFYFHVLIFAIAFIFLFIGVVSFKKVFLLLIFCLSSGGIFIIEGITLMNCISSIPYMLIIVGVAICFFSIWKVFK